jgi:hypothetical protein
MANVLNIHIISQWCDISVYDYADDVRSVSHLDHCVYIDSACPLLTHLCMLLLDLLMYIVLICHLDYN